ncbi:MAG TPA: hypothetical protein PLI66_03785, partial [Spirochaetales bacterium]|nr:hypothetical protein [Spirochaetales bacterium]
PSSPDKPSWSGEASFAAAGAWSEGSGEADDELRYGSDASLRLSLDARRPGLRASVSGRVDALTGSAAAAVLAAGDRFGAIALGTGDAAVALTLDRAYLRWAPGPVVATLGRQVVNWGSALLWSPADLFAETAVVGLEPERSGIDAIRLAAPLGALGGLEAVAVPSASPTDGRYGARLYGYTLGSDLGLQAAWDGGDGTLTAAISLKTDLVVGLWFEAAYTAPASAFLEPAEAGFEATVGLDWSLGGRLVLSAEYRYREGGAASEAESLTALAAGESYPGGHYAYATVNLSAGDFASIGAYAIADLGNAIASVTAYAVVDIAQDASLTAWASYASGSFATLAERRYAGLGASLSLAF